MDAYKVSETQADLPELVDRAAAGEQVLITRDGRPVAELRAVRSASHDPLQTLLSGLKGMAESPISSVELLRRMYEEDELA